MGSNSVIGVESLKNKMHWIKVNSWHGSKKRDANTLNSLCELIYMFGIITYNVLRFTKQ